MIHESDLASAIDSLIRKAPREWLVLGCDFLRATPDDTSPDVVIQRLPRTNNGDLNMLAAQVMRLAASEMSWAALSSTLTYLSKAYGQWTRERKAELLWSGPSPAGQIPARRIDQALYDKVIEAKIEILLVTFAAAKIERLAAVLLSAAGRGVRIRMVLEFEEASEGQLSFDALKAFPQALRNVAEIYFWPPEERQRNQAGYLGKLHAKLALIDDTLLVSSANLTDDAFTRNLEVGVMLGDPQCVRSTMSHFDALVSKGVLRRRT